MAETYDDFIVRSFLITSPNGDETRTTQYQFLTWPDHSVPDSPGPLVEMMSAVDRHIHEISKDESTEQPPMLIHCRYRTQPGNFFVY